MAPAKPLFDDEELEEEPQLRVNTEYAKRFEVRHSYVADAAGLGCCGKVNPAACME